MKAFTPYLIVIALLVATALALLFWVDVEVVDRPGVRLAFPDSVGPWQGSRISFCHQEDCPQSAGRGITDATNACPLCGNALYSMTLIERQQLPADTQFLKYRYTHPNEHVLFVTVVLSGRERNSIHRPQRCLVGQGNEIVDSRVCPVHLRSGSDINVMVLDVVRHLRSADGQLHRYASHYAYWFVGQGRETPYHLARMFWLAWDRLFHSRSHKWAYVIVQNAVREAPEESISEIQSFVAEFYPQILRGQE